MRGMGLANRRKRDRAYDSSIRRGADRESVLKKTGARS